MDSIDEVGRANAEHETRVWVTLVVFCLGLWLGVGVCAWAASGSWVTALGAMGLVAFLLLVMWGIFWEMLI